MSKVFAIIRRDFAHVRSNAIALLVCMGLAVIPALYAWFNIVGGWDPYGNSGQVKVALVSCDEGIRGTIMPVRVNVGERVVTELAKSTKIGYEVTSEQEAIEGVRSGKYYAAAVIPKDFSSNLLSVFTKNPEHPQLDYYVNEKRNAIASIVTNKASGSIQNLVNTGFTEAVAEVAANLFDELSMVIDSDSIVGVAGNLNTALDTSLMTLRRTSSDLAAYVAVTTSIRDVMDTTATLFGTSVASLNAADMLTEASTGVSQFDAAVQTATSALNEALDAGSRASSSAEGSLDNAFATGLNKADDLEGALTRVGDVARERRSDLQNLYDRLESLNGDVYSLDSGIALGGLDVGYTHTITNDISDLLGRVRGALEYLDNLIATNDRVIGDLETTKTNAQNDLATLKDLAAKARSSLDELRATYDGGLSSELERVAKALDDAAGQAAQLATTLNAESTGVAAQLSATSADIAELEGKLTSAAQHIDGAAAKIEALDDKLSQALSSGDVDLVRQVMASGTASFVSFVSSPVALDRKPVFAVENNGSAMTPYYTTMALWVGGTLMGVLLYAGISEEARRKCDAKERHAYLGRLAFFLALGGIQSTFLLVGDLLFLKVQCENPLLFLVTGWVASFTFINIIYALSSSLGDAGKAVAVFIMVVQVAGSGGTFPVEMLPEPFKMLYPYLPFVHAENAFRAAMFGVFDNDWVRELALLAAFLVPALILAVVARPLRRPMEWVEEKLEETKLM